MQRGQALDDLPNGKAVWLARLEQERGIMRIVTYYQSYPHHVGLTDEAVVEETRNGMFKVTDTYPDWPLYTPIKTGCREEIPPDSHPYYRMQRSFQLRRYGMILPPSGTPFHPIGTGSLVLLAGATGYIGRRIAAKLSGLGIPYRPMTRDSAPDLQGVTHIVNAAGYTGKPNVDACEGARGECYAANVTLALRLLELARAKNLPLIHLSSGCVFFRGENLPTTAKRDNRSVYYATTKILAEEAIEGYSRAAIVRLRMPFDSVDEPRNYISKILAYPELLNFSNSITFIPDLIDSLLSIDAGGIYHAVNPGSVRASDLVRLFEEYGIPKGAFQYLPDDCPLAARRSNVTLVPSFDVPTAEQRIREVLAFWKN